jgi:hypothetical protein
VQVKSIAPIDVKPKLPPEFTGGQAVCKMLVGVLLIVADDGDEKSNVENAP